jgi:phospholipid transport system substrate-binding protein
VLIPSKWFLGSGNVGALVLLLGFFGFATAASSPREEIHSAVDAVVAASRDPRFKSSAERRRQLQEIIHARFDFAEMAKRSLGRHWPSRTSAERNVFVAAFRELLHDGYLDAIESYRGEKVKYASERRDGGFAEVTTLIINERGREYSINYRLHEDRDQWKVYDVIMEGMSIVNNYRSEFDRVMTRSSFSELLARMKNSQVDAAGRPGKQQSRDRLTVFAALAQIHGSSRLNMK